MRLIDADAMEKRAYDDAHYHAELEDWEFDVVTHYLDKAPTIDAVPVVRCKDCKWCIEKDELTRSGHCDCVHRDVFVESHNGFEAVDFDDFCSYGERKDGDG